MAIINFERTSFHVDAPGMFTTVQDSGRVGYQQFGMPVAGPMDGESYALGQALVGNFEPKGSLECTVLTPTLTLRGNCIVAFTGADMQPTINHVKVPRYILFCVMLVMLFLVDLHSVVCECIFLFLVVLMYLW